MRAWQDRELTVQEIIRRWPGTVEVFIRHGMNCPGCDMAGFDEIGQAARTYGLAPEALAAELHAAMGVSVMENLGIVQALLGEHGIFYAQFTHLEEALARPVGLEWVQATGGMLAAALGPHAGLENELLFPALEAVMGESGPVAVMREEHDLIESSLTSVLESNDLTLATQSLAAVLRQAREHFAKEEQVLFPMAAKILGKESLAELGRRWAEARAVRLG